MVSLERHPLELGQVLTIEEIERLNAYRQSYLTKNQRKLQKQYWRNIKGIQLKTLQGIVIATTAQFAKIVYLETPYRYRRYIAYNLPLHADHLKVGYMLNSRQMLELAALNALTVKESTFKQILNDLKSENPKVHFNKNEPVGTTTVLKITPQTITCVTQKPQRLYDISIIRL